MEIEPETPGKALPSNESQRELLMSSEQMKFISSFLPKGFSLQNHNKNPRKTSKNLKPKIN